MNEPVLFIYRKEGGRQSEQSKNSKYESMSLEELKANVERADRNWRRQSTIKIFWSREKTGGTQRTFPPADCQRGRV